MQEQELVKQLQQGSREAFDRIYLLYHQQAYRTAFFLTGNRADAQDVVQETFVKVWLFAARRKLQKSLQAGLEPVGSAGINSFWKGSNI